MRVVLTCLREEQADRLDAAVGVLRGSHGREIRTEAFPSLSDLAYRVSEGACAMIVADPSRADPCRSRVPREVVVGDLRPAVAATLLDIRRRDPYAPLVVYSSRSLLPNTLLELGRIGVSSILIHGHNDRPRAVAEVLLTAFCGTAGQRFLATVPSTTTPEVRALIAELVGEPAAVARVGDLARRVYVSESTLRRRFRRERLGCPSTWITWARIFRTVEQSERAGSSLERAALDHGFYSLSHFSDRCVHLTGLRPTRLLLAGGSDRVLHAVTEWLSSMLAVAPGSARGADPEPKREPSPVATDTKSSGPRSVEQGRSRIRTRASPGRAGTGEGRGKG